MRHGQETINRHFRRVLIGRASLYGATCLSTMVLGAGFAQFYAQPDWSLSEHASGLFRQFWPCALGLIFLLPCLLLDLLKLSHAWDKSHERLEHHLAALRSDPFCQPLALAEQDVTHDLAAHANHLQNHVLALHSALDAATTPKETLSEDRLGSPLPQATSDTTDLEPASEAIVMQLPVPTAGVFVVQ